MADNTQQSESSIDENKYKIEMMTYPIDMQGNGQYSVDDTNYVQFFINVQSEAKIAKNKNLVSDIQPDRSTMNSMVGQPIAEGNQQAYVAKVSAYQAGKGAIYGAAAGAAKGGTKVITSTASAALKGAIAGGLTSAATMEGLEFANVQFGQATKRLKAAITLYTPNQLSVRYGTSWGEEEIDLAMSLANTPNPTSAAAEEKPIRSAVASEILKKSASYSSRTRSAANPRKEQVFKGVEYRRFTFDYVFSPRSAQESLAIQNIIYLFKYHMHPEFKDQSANFIYVYPSEFDIEFKIGDKNNDNVHRISSCVLTEMNINYTPNGVFSTFPDGSPTQINMTLNFAELEALTKERIDKGL